jgi:hypothetical protein
MRQAIVLLLAIGVPRVTEAGEASKPNPLDGKKVIEWGWDEPGTKFLRENVETMEQMPFDGLVFHADTNRGGSFTWEMWGKRKFELAEFQPAIDDLRATRFRKLTDRFLRVNVTPGNVDWFDDDAMRVVVQNFDVAAEVARQGAAKGFMWIYTEQPRWWPRQKLPQQYIDALNAARKPNLGVR